MISPDYVKLMARYNAWQNVSLYREAAKLTDAQRREDTGAFFKSIHATLNHLVWGDHMWMSRFAGIPRGNVGTLPSGLDAFPDFNELTVERIRLDDIISSWAASITEADLAGDLTWMSGALHREVSKPRWIPVAHMFNHQTHHRGQVHAMLTSFGAKPDMTDLAFMPDA